MPDKSFPSMADTFRWIKTDGVGSVVIAERVDGGTCYAQFSTPDAAKAVVRAVEQHDEIYDALEWLVHAALGIGKSGGSLDWGEPEAAIDAGKAALDKARGEQS